MAFDPIPLSRDLLNLAAGLLGIGLSLALPKLASQGSSLRVSRLRGVCSALVVSAAIGAGALSFIVSRTEIFKDFSYLPVALGIFAAAALGAAFPRVVGFPCLIGACSATVIFAWAFLAYPAVSEGIVLARFRATPEKNLRIWFDSDAPDPAIVAASSAPVFKISRIDLDRRIPLVGGSVRMSVREVSSGTLSAASPVRRSLLDIFGQPVGRILSSTPGVAVSALESVSPPEAVRTGARVNLVWSGGALHFSP